MGAMKYNKHKSTYEQRIKDTGETYGNMQDTMEMIQVDRKSRHIKSGEVSYFCTQKRNKETKYL
jgi:hypothetical protein